METFDLQQTQRLAALIAVPQEQRDVDAAMRYLTWFVPKTYSLMPLPDEWSDQNMAAL